MRLKRVLAALLTPFMMLLNCPVMEAQAGDAPAVKPTTEIFHKAAESAEAGKRITIYTEVSDQNGVDIVRVYFKSKDAADFSFIALKQVETQEKGLFEKFQNLGSDFKGQGYSGILPAPANGSKAFEYLVLVKNKANIVIKSQTYAIAVADSKDSDVAVKEPIQVYTELSEAPKTVAGFSDNITVDIAESGAKAGIVAGLYSGLTSASGGGAVSGGTVAASSGGFTTTAAVVGGTAAVVVVGGVAAAAGGDSSSSGGGGQALNATNIVGVWHKRGPDYDCNVVDGQDQFTESGVRNYSYTVVCPAGSAYNSRTRTNLVGRWSISGSTLTICDYTGTCFDITGGTSNSFSITFPSGTLTWTKVN